MCAVVAAVAAYEEPVLPSEVEEALQRVLEEVLP